MYPKMMHGLPSSVAFIDRKYPRQYFAYAMKGCTDSTIAGPNNVITNQVSLKSEAKPRYDEN